MTLLDDGLPHPQLRAAHGVAAQLADALAVPPPPELGDDRSPRSPRWRGQSLAKGAAGAAILHGVRAHIGLGSWERVVHGLAGLGAYLLRRDSQGDLVRQVLAYLVRLTEPLPVDDQAGVSAPGWWTSDVPSGRPADAFCGGHADLGMAHGISGPLALLALARRQEITVEGQAAAIDRICHWLDAWRHDGPAGPWWPERIGLAEGRTGRSAHPGPARPSWCYGTPGLARAQQLAGQATGDHARQQLAERALAGCLSDPAQLARITDPALCHGWAGLIATAWCAAADARSPDIAAHLPRLLDTLLDHADRGDSPSWRLPGLIEGSAGIAATLHSIATGTSSGWETCLLIN